MQSSIYADSIMPDTIRTREYADFVGKLRKARLEAGLRQIDVAKKLKRTQSYVSRVEVGEQRLDILELKKFASLYKKDTGFYNVKLKQYENTFGYWHTSYTNGCNVS